MSSRASAHFRQMIKSSSLLSVKEIVKPYLPRSWLYGSNGDIYWLNFKKKKKKKKKAISKESLLERDEGEPVER